MWSYIYPWAFSGMLLLVAANHHLVPLMILLMTGMFTFALIGLLASSCRISKYWFGFLFSVTEFTMDISGSCLNAIIQTWCCFFEAWNLLCCRQTPYITQINSCYLPFKGHLNLRTNKPKTYKIIQLWNIKEKNDWLSKWIG